MTRTQSWLPTVVTAWLMCLVTATVSAEVTLIDNGRPQATIVIADRPTNRDKVVAEDLQAHLKQMSGAELPIVAEQNRPDGLCVDIGATSRGLSVREALARRNDLNDEALVIIVDADRVILIGRTDPATGHAAYMLLERLGVRWLMPTPKGTFVPKLKSVKLQNQVIHDQPAFIMRAGLPAGDARDGDPDGTGKAWPNGVNAWGRRNRFGGIKWMGSGHSFQYLVPWEKYGATNPEWFSLHDGHRDRKQLCVSNQDVIRVASETVIQWAQKSPGRLFCVSPNDGSAETFCECENCRKLGNVSDQIVYFANEVTKRLVEHQPDAMVTYLVDYHAAGLPLNRPPHRNTVFWIPKWSVDRAHGIHHPKVKRFKDALTNWSRYGNQVITYTYYGHYNVFTYWPILHVMKVDIPYMWSQGVRGMYSQTNQNWGCQGLNYYVYAKMAWDPHVHVDAVVDEYCRLAFGPAYQTMLRYYDLLERTMDGGRVHYGRNFESAWIFTPAVVAEADALMQQALDQVERHVAGDPDEGLLWRMRYVAKGQELAKHYLSGHHAKMRYVETRDKALLETMKQHWTKTLSIMEDPGLPGVVEIPRMVRHLMRDLAPLEERLVYGPGPFQYHDGLDGGGKAVVHASTWQGFVAGDRGLNLRPHGSGTVSWRFEAERGCHFQTVRIEQVSRGAPKTTVSIRSPLTKGRTIELSPDEALNQAPLDLTRYTKGTAWFEIHITARNTTTNDILVIDQIAVDGAVVKDEDDRAAVVG